MSSVAPEDDRRCALYSPRLPRLGANAAPVVDTPPSLQRALEAFLARQRPRAHPEEGAGRVVHSTSGDVASHYAGVHLDPELEKRILRELHPLLEAWCGEALEPVSADGIRLYRRGAVLRRHVDRVESHALSALLLVDQDVDTPWPITLECDGRRRDVVLEPGRMLLYEGAKDPHARAEPLDGAEYACLLVHYKPRWWRFGPERVEALEAGGSARLDYGDSAGAPHRVPEAPRYLRFEPDRGGWNQVLMQFEIMLALAWLTGRTLVLPPPRKLRLLGDEPRHLLDFLDLEAMRRAVPVIRQEALPPGLTRHAPHWNALDDVLVHSAHERPTDGRRVRRLRGAEHACEVLDFPADAGRMFGVFDDFLRLGDGALARWVRRVVRDAVRYRPEIVGLAERALGSPALHGGFSALHVRRGDFQYAETRIDAEDLLRHVRDDLVPGQTLYVASDEPAPAFLAPLREEHFVVTWDRLDPDVRAGTPDHWRGIVETLVCAGAPGRFFGTRLSTFSARVATLRGHLARTAAWAGLDTELRYTQPPPDGETPVWGRAHPRVWLGI